MPSPFPIRGAECEIMDSESDDDYLEGEHGAEDNGVDDDDDVPSTLAIIQHPEDPLSFMCVLDP